MKKSLRAVALACVLGAFAAPSAHAAAKFTVTVSNFKYTPSALTITQGDTVRFVNAAGSQFHTATNGTSAMDPNAGTIFDITLTGGGASGLWVSNTSGVIPVFCRNHDGFMNMTLTVNSSNRPPVVNAISNQVVNENQLLTVTPSGSDPDGDVLTWSGSSLPSGATVSSSTGVLTWTPTFSQSGLYPGVTITANDGRGGTASASFSITVNNVNRSPSVASIPNQVVEELHTLVVTPSGSDPDGDALTWSGTGVPAGATLNSSTGQLTWTPQPSDVGSVSHVTLTASDPGSLTASASFDITVTLDASSIPLDGLPAPTALGIVAIAPNPFSARSEIIVGSPARTAATVSLWTVSGRQVAVLSHGTLAQGYSRFTWSGTDSRGARVAGGVYLLRVEGAGRQVQQRIVKID